MVDRPELSEYPILIVFVDKVDFRKRDPGTCVGSAQRDGSVVVVHRRTHQDDFGGYMISEETIPVCYVHKRLDPVLGEELKHRFDDIAFGWRDTFGAIDVAIYITVPNGDSIGIDKVFLDVLVNRIIGVGMLAHRSRYLFVGITRYSD